jgi:hypothetical protein
MADKKKPPSKSKKVFTMSPGMADDDFRDPSLVQEDNTSKGSGFFGPIDGRMTELSGSSGRYRISKPYTDKEDLLYPSMVPTLSDAELSNLTNESLADSERFTPQIWDKAEAHARQRLAQGKSPFAQAGEQYPAPGRMEDFMREYPNAVQSLPNRTVGYKYGSRVEPFRVQETLSSPRMRPRFGDETPEEYAKFVAGQYGRYSPR